MTLLVDGNSERLGSRPPVRPTAGTWLVNSGVAILDQAIFSGANLVITVVMARTVSTAELGSFAMVFAAFLFLSGFHNALVLEPMSVLGPAQYPRHLADYMNAQVTLHFALCGSAGVLMCMAAGLMWMLGNPLAPATLACALALPFLLFLWLVRRYCYCLQRPSAALVGSVSYCVTCFAGLIVLWTAHRLSSMTALLMMGVASVPAAVLCQRLTRRERHAVSVSIRLRAVLADNWRYGRSLVVSTALYSVATQIQLFIAGALLGVSAAGVLRAASVPMLAMVQAITAISTLALPVFAAEFSACAVTWIRRSAQLLSGGLCLAAIVVETLLFTFRSWVATALHLDSPVGTVLLPVMGLIAIFTALGTGSSVALRAIQRPDATVVFGAIAAPAGVVTAFAFTTMWGVAGLAWSMVASAAIGSAIYWALLHRWLPAGSAAPLRVDSHSAAGADYAAD